MRLIRLRATGLTLLVSIGAAQAAITHSSFGKTQQGDNVEIYTLTNKRGMEVRVMTYGATVVSVKVPDRKGQYADVVLGFDTLEPYLGTHPYFGAVIGRYGNRIGGAKFTLNGKTYELAKNDGSNSLHGGLKGFDKRIWTVMATTSSSITLRYISKDGEEGFPGKLTATVMYTLTDRDELRIHYFAKTDKDTVVNLTNHSYFNLDGAGNGDVLKHEVTIEAAQFTPVDAGLIPTGELRAVDGSPFDFRKATAIGARINQNDEQIRLGGGYDHNFVLSPSKGAPVKAAEVYEPTSGRVMEVLTTEPGLQFYTGNFLDGSIHGKGGKPYHRRFAFCMETQHFPDSPNRDSFPSVVLKVGKQYRTTTIYRFSTR